ncbi:M4 family metallopeptidase [Kitasatospora sp. NPDC002227]|uniref:M4 family metallopeptidase n=1 Tax=Kitasatospora sp. NPDC002227 TaxID=3154773 RepID=UPI0033235647
MRATRIRDLAVVVVMTTTASVTAGALGTASASPLATTAAAQAVSAADRAAHSHAAETGVGAQDRLKAVDTVVDRDGSKHVRFVRTHRGLPVLGADLVVHLDAKNAYRGVTRATKRQVDTPATTPKLSADQARAAAAAAAKGQAGQAELVVSALADRTPVLAYRVKVTDSTSTEDGGSRTVVVDATTGGVLSNSPANDSFLTPDVVAKLHRQGPALAPAATPAAAPAAAATVGANGTGYSLFVGTVPLTTTQSGSTYVLRDPSRGNTEVRDARNIAYTNFASGSAITSTTNKWGNGTTANRTSAAVDAQYGVTSTLDFYRSAFGRNGITGDGSGAHAMVHYGYRVGNAYWNPDCACMLYGDGDGTTFTKPLVVLDVTGHELTHGVVNATADLQPTRVDAQGHQYGEPGALNESLADIFGSGVEFATNNPNNPPNYLIGEKLGLQQGFLRRLDHPSLDQLEGTIDYWSDTTADAEVHAGSGVSSHAFYLLAEGSGAKTIGNYAYDSDTYDGSTVTGIGRDKALAVFYRALTVYMVSSTSFHDARTATLSAAGDLYGTDSVEYQTVDQAWAAVNVTAANG